MILCIHNVDILNICMKEFGSQKIMIDKMTAIRTFFWIVLQRGYAFSIIVHTRANQLLSQLLIEHFDTLPTQCRHIEHMHEGVWFTKNIIDKMAAMSTLTFFRLVSTKRGYACSMIVHTRADQLLPQLVMELFETLYAQC